MRELLLARALVTPVEVFTDAALVLEDGQIAAVGRREDVAAGRARVTDLGDATLSPGLIDVHVHGGAGVDAMTADRAGLLKMARHLACHGVTSFLPTTVTAPWDETLRAVERLGALELGTGVAEALGVHLEGPFLSPHRRGVHPPEHLLPPSLDRWAALDQAAQGRVRWLTVAPELAGALEFIAAATHRGVVVSLGHSDATRAQARAGLTAGAVHVTHTFNAMPPLHHREPGLLGEALTNPGLSAEIIADGIHVDPALVKMFLHLKGRDRALLVSDGISAAGCGDGEYSLAELRVLVRQGECRLADDGPGDDPRQGRLAGSVLVLDQAVRNTMQFADWDLSAAVQAASWNAARLLGLDRKGRLAPGADADIVAWSPTGEVAAVWVRGHKLE